MVSFKLQLIPKMITKLKMMWTRREIENYLPIPEVLERYIEKQGGDVSLIRELMDDYMPPIAKKDKTESWWDNTGVQTLVWAVRSPNFSLGNPS